MRKIKYGKMALQMPLEDAFMQMSVSIKDWTHKIVVIKQHIDDVQLMVNQIIKDPFRMQNETGLSKRESEVFRLIGQNKKVREIAFELGINRKTVEAHREHIRKKLGLSNADELRTMAKAKGEI